MGGQSEVPAVGSASVLYLLGHVALAARIRLAEAIADQGITTQQYTALSVLARNRGMTATRLARASFVRIQSAARMVGVLVEAGWVAREPDPRSKRQVLLSLTPEGERLMAVLSEPVAALEREILADLSSERYGELVEGLRDIRHRLAGVDPY